MQLTVNQQHVLTTLKQARTPLSAYALLDRLREHGIGAPTQVYRALERLAEHGMVHRLESLNAYVCCSRPHGHRDALAGFAICEDCGQVSEFGDDDLKCYLGRCMQKSAFRLSGAAIELRGKCAACVDRCELNS